MNLICSIFCLFLENCLTCRLPGEMKVQKMKFRTTEPDDYLIPLTEQHCYEHLIEILHEESGLACPQGHRLPDSQAPHDRRRFPVNDFRCRQCGGVFNIFSGTLWCGTRYPCSTILAILQGIKEGISTSRLAREVRISRPHLQERRREVEEFLKNLTDPHRFLGLGLLPSLIIVKGQVFVSRYDPLFQNGRDG